MCDVSRFVPQLAAAKKFLISVPWGTEVDEEETAIASPSSHAAPHHRRDGKLGSEREPVATAVLCQLVEMRRLRALLHAAAEQQQQQQQAQPEQPAQRVRKNSSADAHFRGGLQESTQHSQHRHKKHGKTVTEGASPDAVVFSAVLRRYLALLAGCEAHVQALCAVRDERKEKVKESSSGGYKSEVKAPDDGEDDAVEVLFTLLLCMSAALCWQHKQQHVSLQPRTLQSSKADVVSSSRETSAHSAARRGSALSTGTMASAARHSLSHSNVYSAIRQHYEIGAIDSNPSAAPQRSLKAALRRRLPQLEACLPASELWREPALLAALDAVARALWAAQARVHGSTLATEGQHAVRCPVCYAAALNDNLAVETFVQLHRYYELYHTGDVHGRGGAEQLYAQGQRHPSTVQALGWVAACRIAVWNHCGAVVDTLAAQQSPTPWGCEGPSLPPAFAWASGISTPRLLMLWTHWWRAEMQVAALTTAQNSREPCSSSSSSIMAKISRDPLKRLRSCQLFLSVVASAARCAGVAEDDYHHHVTDTSLSEVDYRHEVAQHQQREAANSHRLRQEEAHQLRQAMLLWLLSFPFTWECPTTPNQAPVASSPACATSPENHSKGTIAPSATTLFHWLSAHNDVALMRLLLLHCSACDVSPLLLPEYRTPQKDSQTNDKAAIFLGNVLGPAGEQAKPLNTTPLEGNATGHGPTTRESLRSTAGDQSAPIHVVQLAKNSSAAASNAHTLANTPREGPLPHPLADARLARCSAHLRGVLGLLDSTGRTALDRAYQHGHMASVQLLLQAGCSPNALHLATWRSTAPTLSVPLLRLLYDPSVLDGARGSGPLVGLAERLRSTHCPAAAARALAHLAHRLWTEKVRLLRCPRLSATLNAATGENVEEAQERSDDATGPPQQPLPPTAQETQNGCKSLASWYSAYTQCQAAQDRVLRPALAALAYDAHEPRARLVILAVLAHKLHDWLSTLSPQIRGGDTTRGEAAAAKDAVPLREVRLQHTVALRLYTQLTCPLGRAILDRAVAVRSAICAAVELREEGALAMVRAASAATSSPSVAADAEETRLDGDTGEKHTGSSTQHQQQHAIPLPPSEAATSRLELQHFYAATLADVQRLDLLLAAEQRRVTADNAANTTHAASVLVPGEATASASADVDASTGGVATVLRGRSVSAPNTSAASSSPAYVLVVIPSSIALQHARWDGCSRSSRGDGAAVLAPNEAHGLCPVVEPTLWWLTQRPQQVWVQLPRHLDLDRLLREHGGGGYGVVSQDMPLAAPIQRGDFVTFRHVKAAGGAPPQFLLDAVFSDQRTLPYLALAPKRAASLTLAPPPASLVLPFTGMDASTQQQQQQQRGSSALASPFASSHHSQLSELVHATTVTLHACCLPALYMEGNAAGDTDVGQHHPLDWLQASPSAAAEARVGTAARDVLVALGTDQQTVSRWSQLMWAGVQPCWLASAAAKGGEQGNAANTFTALHLFGTVEGEREEADGQRRRLRRLVADPEQTLLHVCRAAACTAEDGSNGDGEEKSGHIDQPSMRWSTRPSTCAITATADRVVGVAL